MENKFNNILTHKILPFLSIIILFLFVFSTFSFGSTPVTMSDGNTYNFPDFSSTIANYSDYVIVYGSNTNLGTYFILVPYNIDNYKMGFYEASSGKYSLCMYYANLEMSYQNRVKYSCKRLTSLNSSWTSYTTSDNSGFYFNNGITAVFTTQDLYTEKGELLFPSSIGSATSNPSFITTQSELSSGKFDTLKIDAGDFDNYEDNFIFNIYDTYDMGDGVYSDYIKKSFLLDSSSSYLKVSDSQVYYYIPQSSLGIDISNGKRYTFELKAKGSDEVYSSVSFQISGLTSDEEIKNSQDITNDKLDEQTNAIKESNETNKNIFERIGEMLSYINPFSENFFVYKLIELLIDMLKSLFVPGENFFLDWINDLNDYFGDRFGIIYYPFELLIDFLTRIGSISVDSDSAIISFGDLKLWDITLIPAFEFDFFSLLTNDTLKDIHNIYLVCVDVILYLGLVLLSKNIFSEVFGGHFVDEVISDTTADERSYSNYERYQGNKDRYNKEHGGSSK